MISMYPPGAPFPVYDQQEWWGDDWDAREYGQEFDFSRPFFEQFQELFQKVPRISLMNKDHENSEYCNFCLGNKDSYLLFTSAFAEDSFHTNRSLRMRDICDCSNITDSELCYEVIDSDHCYGSAWLQSCRHCQSCFLGYDLSNCADCFACWGLTQAKYRIMNVQYPPAEYAEKVKALRTDMDRTRAEFFSQLRKSVHKYSDLLNVENCSGGALSESKNARFCFEAKDLEDCAYVYNATQLKNSRDVNNDDSSELGYEVIGGDSNFQQIFSDISWSNHNIAYCSLCFHSHDLFGCIGMKKAECCILNKQYSKEEYGILVPRIIEHMMKTREWGEFFPTEISPFAYNGSIAQEYFPLSKDEVLKRGWRWKEKEEPDFSGVAKRIPAAKLPDDISEIPDDVLNWAIECAESKRLFMIQKAELDFYRKMNLPLPKFHPDIRHRKRLALRNPRKLWERTCSNCKTPITTPYAPDRPEIVCCEDCYLKTVYA